MKTIDLSDLKVGDKAWSTQQGEVEVVRIVDGNFYPIHTKTEVYALDGKFSNSYEHPTLFHSEQEFRDYWGIQRDIDAPLTKREQFAMAAMQGLLNSAYDKTYVRIAEQSCKYADALLTKLNETK
jgi:hypothetical protein